MLHLLCTLFLLWLHELHLRSSGLLKFGDLCCRRRMVGFENNQGWIWDSTLLLTIDERDKAGVREAEEPTTTNMPQLGSSPTLFLVSLQRGTAAATPPTASDQVSCRMLNKFWRSWWQSGHAYAQQPGLGQTCPHDLILTRTAHPAGAPACPLTLLPRDPGPAQGRTTGHPSWTPGLESKVVTPPCRGPFGGENVVSCCLPQLSQDILCGKGW